MKHSRSRDTFLFLLKFTVIVITIIMITVSTITVI